MIRQLGTPTFFFTVSAADMKWPEVIQNIAKQYGQIYTDQEVADLSFEERSKWLRQNPVTAARHFQFRLDTFFKSFLKSSAHPLGEIVDYAIRIEFQNRGSPHAHCVLWVKDAPKFGQDPNDIVCAFIDKYISCKLPREEGKIRELVLAVQQHRHSTYCKKRGKCRFNFPHPPSSCTLIAGQGENEEIIKAASNTLQKVKAVLNEYSKSEDLTLDTLLEKAEVSKTDYERALNTTSKGSSVGTLAPATSTTIILMFYWLGKPIWTYSMSWTLMLA